MTGATDSEAIAWSSTLAAATGPLQITITWCATQLACAASFIIRICRSQVDALAKIHALEIFPLFQMVGAASERLSWTLNAANRSCFRMTRTRRTTWFTCLKLVSVCLIARTTCCRRLKRFAVAARCSLRTAASQTALGQHVVAYKRHLASLMQLVGMTPLGNNADLVFAFETEMAQARLATPGIARLLCAHTRAACCCDRFSCQLRICAMKSRRTTNI